LNLSDRIKALPAIKDEAGAECVSREVVLGIVEGACFEAHEELAKFIDVCAEQCAMKARAICEPNYWWPKNQVLRGVAEQIRARAEAERQLKIAENLGTS